jgi:hypothetical protein
MQEVIGIAVYRELEIAEFESAGNSFLERCSQIVNGPNLNNTLDFLSGYESQLQ